MAAATEMQQGLETHVFQPGDAVVSTHDGRPGTVVKRLEDGQTWDRTEVPFKPVPIARVRVQFHRHHHYPAFHSDVMDVALRARES